MISHNLTMISSEGEQWGRYNLPSYLLYKKIVIFHSYGTDLPNMGLIVANLIYPAKNDNS